MTNNYQTEKFHTKGFYKLKERILFIIIFILAILGIIFSIELIIVHHEVQNGIVPSCSISSKVDCAPAAHSVQSVFLNVPVALWGALSYLAWAVLSFFGIKNWIWKNKPKGIFFFTSLAAVFYSLYLAYVMIFKLKSICIYCSFLDFINVSIFIISALSLKKDYPHTFLINEITALKDYPRLVTFSVVFCFALVINLIIFYPQPEQNYSSIIQHPDKQKVNKAKIVSKNDPFEGNTKAKVELIIFSDYFCPICREAHRDLNKILPRFLNKIKVIYKQFPLDTKCNSTLSLQMHPGACFASTAALCAHKQGKFFEMSNLLYEMEDEPDENNLLKLAKKINLDLEVFKTCFKSSEINKEIENDIKSGEILNIEGTPAFVINRQEIIPGWLPPDVFVKILDELTKQ